MDRPLFEERVVRFAPPYILTPEQVRRVRADLAAALQELASRGG
jgi:adenosylmethionine-8-amino-7-oxononanoate aminotransferase